MTVFGYDVSHFQGDFDHARAKRQGMRFVYVKCTEGRTWRDEDWPANRDAARASGLYLAAYHFLRSDSTAGAQARNIARYLGDRSIPVVVDCEPGSSGSRPSVRKVRAFVRACRRRGVKVSLLYLPRWYWESLGRPSLDNTPPLVQSNYGNNPAGKPADIYPGDGSDRWDYAGHPVTVLQFGDRGTVAGQAIDVDAYRGEVSDLARWFLPPKEESVSTAYQVIRTGTDSSGRPTYMNRRLKQAFDRACDLSGVTPTVVQGAYMRRVGGGAGASAGTHDGGGCLDLRTWNLTETQWRKWIRTARAVGFAAWVRDQAHGGFDPHIHANLLGDRDATDSAKWQWSEYRAGRDGLASRGNDYHWRPDPIPVYRYKEPESDPMEEIMGWYNSKEDFEKAIANRVRDDILHGGVGGENREPYLKKQLEDNNRIERIEKAVNQILRALKAHAGDK